MSPVQRIYHELVFEYVRSRGPGGQNVNRTNSACVLRWNVQDTQGFTDTEKLLLLSRWANRLTESGELILRSDMFRDQPANKKANLQKLNEMITQGLLKPKTRFKTKPPRSAQRQRRESKSRRSEIKSHRQKVQVED